MNENLKKLYRKYSKVGLRKSLSKQSDRNDFMLDPIVKDVAQASNIDLYATIPESNFFCDRLLLFSALLLTNHPKVIHTIQDIRNGIGIHKFLKYTKEWDAESTQFTNTSLVKIEKPLRKKVDKALNYFFANVGKNLSRQDWEHEIAIYILTNILPLPFQSLESFQIYSSQNKAVLNERDQYPVIVIKKRIKEQELNQLVEFIRDSEGDLIKATHHLPSEPVKRVDVYLTKLAIGLWIYKNESLGNKWMEDYKDKKNKENAKYFGDYSEKLGKEDFPNFKSDALGYLKQLYPL